MANSTGCSSRVPGFDSQHADGCSEGLITPVPLDCRPSAGSAGTRDTKGAQT